MIGARLLGLVGLGVRQLRYERARTIFAVLGLAFAVLSVTLLLSIGTGVVATGQEQFAAADRDLWVTGGPIEIDPETIGGFRSGVVDAHNVSAGIEAHEDVANAAPMAFQAVYVSAGGEHFSTMLGTGVPGGGSSIRLTAGEGFQGGDTHYAGGTYDGPMTHEVIIDPGTAERFDVGVGDTLYIGGTIGNARRNAFTVVGISPTFASFLGAETVTIRLSELQTLTGAAFEDRATLILVTLTEGADPAAVRADLAEAYPEYTIRTNREQLVAVVERQAVVVAGGVSLAGVAVLSGVVLSLNLLLSMIYQQRQAFAVIRAIGGSRASVIGLCVLQALVIGSIGGALGLALTAPLAAGLETIVADLTGFEGLVRVSREAYLAGGAVALTFSVIGAALGGWRVGRQRTVATLTR